MTWIEKPGNDPPGFNLTQLKVDECWITTNLTVKDPLWLYMVYEDCYKCPYKIFKPDPLVDGEKFVHASLPVQKWRLMKSNVSDISFVEDTTDVLCDLKPDVGEFGIYTLNASPGSCFIETITEPVNIFLPIIIPVLIFLLIGIFYLVISKIHSARKTRKIVHATDGNTVEAKAKVPSVRRITAIDTFRGISISIMIFVNDGAGRYEFMEHATWNGLQVADLVFPWFMWIMGTCIPISIRSQLRKNVPRWFIALNILKRSLILFVLGLMLNTQANGPALASMRIFGVLQRFAVCYLVVGLISAFCTRRSDKTPESKFAVMFQDILVIWLQWTIVLAILVVYLCIVFLLEVPDCPSGYLGPGGLHENGKYEKCTGGATGYVDRLVLGDQHIYQWPTARQIYSSGAFDPEGVLGCLPSIVEVFLGVQAGSILLAHKNTTARVVRWLAWAGLTGLLGGILCLFGKEDGWIPVNKNLWSLSFVLVTSCFAFILLTWCYLLIDVWHVWTGKPFLFPGMNSTIMYFGHSVAYNMFPFHWAYGPMNTHFVLLMEALWGTCAWIGVAYWLWWNKFFLSI